MKTTLKTFSMGAAVAAALALSASAAMAGGVNLIFGADSGSTNYNDPDFTGAAGAIDFSFLDQATEVLVTMTIFNTTGDTTFGSGATGSKLVGVGFDLPTGVTYVGPYTPDTDNHFPYLGFNDSTLNGTPKLADGTPLTSFNDITFDVAVTLKEDDLSGGGSPSAGLPEDDSAVVSFILDGLDAAGMMSAFQTGFDDGSLFAGMRFKDVNAGAGSEKLLYNGDGGGTCGPNDPSCNVVPLPASAWLMLAGILGLGIARRRIRVV